MTKLPSCLMLFAWGRVGLTRDRLLPCRICSADQTVRQTSGSVKSTEFGSGGLAHHRICSADPAMRQTIQTRRIRISLTFSEPRVGSCRVRISLTFPKTRVGSSFRSSMFFGSDQILPPLLLLFNTKSFFKCYLSS